MSTITGNRFLQNVALVVLATLLSLLCSCTRDISSVQNKRGEGVKRVYPYPYSATWDATLNGIKKLGVFIQDSEVSSGVIYGKIDRGGERGTYVGIYISKNSATSTEVEIVDKREDPANPFVGDWTDDIFQAIETQLKK